MSQFILFTLKSETKISEAFSLITVSEHNREFLSNVAIKLFKRAEGVYTILNFETICTETQKALLSNPFDKTLLFSLLNELGDNEIYF